MELLECQFSWFLLLSLYFNQLKKRKAFPHYQYLKYMMRVSEELEEVPATAGLLHACEDTQPWYHTQMCSCRGEKKKTVYFILLPICMTVAQNMSIIKYVNEQTPQKYTPAACEHTAVSKTNIYIYRFHRPDYSKTLSSAE